MEQPTQQNTNESAEELASKAAVLVSEAISFIKRAYDLDLNNYEKMKLWAGARKIIQDNDKKMGGVLNNRPDHKLDLEDDLLHEAVWRTDLYGSKELVHSFFLNEIGVHPNDFPIEGIDVPEDFKIYLKQLFKEHRDGYSEQSNLTPRE